MVRHFRFKMVKFYILGVKFGNIILKVNLFKLNAPSIYTLIKIERFQIMKPIRKNKTSLQIYIDKSIISC